MYDIFFTSTNFFLSLVFSIMVFLLTLIIFMAQLSCTGHSLIWRLSDLGGARQTEGWYGSFAVFPLWGWWGGREIESILVASMWLFLPALPHLPSFLWGWIQVMGKTETRSGKLLILWPPQRAIWRPLLLLINDLPAVCTNFIAFMYAHALYFSLFSPTTPNATNMKYELKSLISALGKRPA